MDSKHVFAAAARDHLAQVCRHSHRTGRECAGLLMGREMVIEDAVEFSPQWSTSENLCLAPRSWSLAFEELHRRGISPESIIGWYHTHPGGDLELSTQDRRFQSMFRRPGQIALVLNPADLTGSIYYAQAEGA